MPKYTPNHDYYAILGIKPTADAASIKRAYRTLIARHHPDKHSHATAADGQDARIFLINEAYATLKDPAKRQTYDEARAVMRMEALFHKEVLARAKRMREQFVDNFKDNAALVKAALQHLKTPSTDAKTSDNTQSPYDVHLQVQIFPWQAPLGETLLVSTPRQRLRLTLPRDANHGTRLKIIGKGQPKPEGGFGDVYLTLVIKNPDVQALSDDQRAAFLALKAAFEPE